ncbi:MAG: methyl coenzyme M reductase-arginine methyltransferase Mmp10 [Methanobacteriaceae archaeon]|jgi:methanogenesis marker radical SAM protein|nr:methyl coenzyme M reductase-arginine methyltransferase Mmp10 [Methanobacteriaceae archaeon]
MQIVADVGGIPGKDCRGYCKYCYFRKVKPIEPLGCRYCPPNSVGCARCSEGICETGTEFKPSFLVMNEIQTSMMMNQGLNGEFKVNISGGGDVSCYPQLEELVSGINQFGLKSHLGYTSGKGIDDSEMASRLMNLGVDEVTFTLFADDIGLRKEWVKDPTPEASLESAKLFAENANLYAASVIIPGVNDGEVLRKTCESLESWGAKALLLMRFANTTEQGLILGNAPVVDGIESQSIEEFSSLVDEINKEYSLRVTGTPLGDPTINAPFIISKEGNEEYLQFLKEVTGEATIVTSKIAAPFISAVFKKIGANTVNVIGTNKDIACLMTREDFESIDLSNVKDSVIIPGRSFVHDKVVEDIFSRDGVERVVGRGPDTLSVDGELSSGMTDEEVIMEEIESFRDLIDAINFFGMRKV